MAEDYDNLDLDLDSLDQNIEKKNKVEQRIKDLSTKVKLTSEERDELKVLNVALTTERDTITKERDFFASFTDTTAKFPGAAEYKDAIKEKVLAGYSVEDAAAAILAREGKLVAPTPEPVKPESPAGGSAITQPQVGGEKELGEMTQEEKREKLLESPGDLEQVLRSGR